MSVRKKQIALLRKHESDELAPMTFGGVKVSRS
jgi:hypothetical protein